MTVYTFTPATSIFTDGTVGFENGTAAADSLSLLTGAHIFTDGFAHAIHLKGPGAWTATINGDVTSTFRIGLLLDAGLPLSTINIGIDGSIYGAVAAIEADSPVTITNRGALSSDATSPGTLRFSGTGEHRLTNYGTISSGLTAIFDFGNVGTEIIDNRGSILGDIDLGGGNDRIVNSGFIEGRILLGSGVDSITNSGTMKGEFDFGDGNNTLTNSGKFGGPSELSLIFGSGNDTINNTGQILSGSGGVLAPFQFGDGTNILNNSGSFASNDLNGGSGVDRITNSGTLAVRNINLFGGNDIISNSGQLIANSIYLGTGTNSFTNSSTGKVQTSLTGDTGVDSFTNSGVFIGNIGLGNGADVFNNSGVVTGGVSLQGTDTATDRFTNSGTITGNIGFGDGNDVATNSGTINGLVDMQGGTNRFSNSGIVTGDYYGARIGSTGYNIVYDYAVVAGIKISGRILGKIVLSAGSDQFYGGDNAEIVSDAGGVDRYLLAGGDDSYSAILVARGGGNDGLDYVDGGAGSDTLKLASFAAIGHTVINLDTVSHNYGPGFANSNGDPSAANRVTSDGSYLEQIFNFENVEGTGSNDTIYGNAAANSISGDAGSDILHGYAGNDVLDGGIGVDLLIGGLGRDVLTGGTDKDYFVFVTEADSVLGAQRDVITDFHMSESDLIAVDAIDANTTNAAGTDDSFNSFIGVNKAFAINTPGTLRAVWTSTGWLVEGNTDNDTAAEFQIAVNDSAHSILWGINLFSG
jgi:RTX calcium-binding nonapeptide repeat (4 copies)